MLELQNSILTISVPYNQLAAAGGLFIALTLNLAFGLLQ